MSLLFIVNIVNITLHHCTQVVFLKYYV